MVNRHHQRETSGCSSRNPRSRPRPGTADVTILEPAHAASAGLRDDVTHARLAAVAITLSTRVRTPQAAMAGRFFLAVAAALTFSASSVIRAQAYRDIPSPGRDGGARWQDAGGQPAVGQGRFPCGDGGWGDTCHRVI